MKHTIGLGVESGTHKEIAKTEKTAGMLRENETRRHNSFLRRMKRNAAGATIGVAATACVMAALAGCGGNQPASGYTYRTVKIDPSLVAGQQNGTYTAAFKELLLENGFKGNDLGLKEASSDVNDGDVLVVFGQDKNVMVFYEPQVGRRTYGEAWFYYGPAEASVSEAESVEKQIRKELPTGIQMAPVSSNFLAEVIGLRAVPTTEEQEPSGQNPKGTATSSAEKASSLHSTFHRIERDIIHVGEDIGMGLGGLIVLIGFGALLGRGGSDSSSSGTERTPVWHEQAGHHNREWETEQRRQAQQEEKWQRDRDARIDEFVKDQNDKHLFS